MLPVCTHAQQGFLSQHSQLGLTFMLPSFSLFLKSSQLLVPLMDLFNSDLFFLTCLPAWVNTVFFIWFIPKKTTCVVVNYLLLGGLVLFSSSKGVLTQNNLRDFSVFQSGLGLKKCLWSLTWFISKTFSFQTWRKQRPPPIQECCVYPGHLRSRLLIPALQVRLQGLHTLHAPAASPGAAVLLVHSPALHHYSKSYVLGEQIRAQWKIIHWPIESLELRLNQVS